MLIPKIANVDEVTKKIFYRNLTSRLLELVGQDYFPTQECLKETVQEIMTEDRQSYREYLDDILKEIAPEGYELTWRDCTRLTANRWRLCRICGEPFISTDYKNRQRICYLKDYKRYRAGNDQREGKFFKGALQGYSACFMKGKGLLERDRMREKKRLERELA